MLIFSVIAASIWALLLAAGLLWKRASRQSDLARVKARLTGAGEPRKKNGRSGPALIQADEASASQVVLRLLNRIRLKDRANRFLEQAGLKWSLARTIHGVLGLALAGFTAIWYLAPSFRLLAPAAAAAAAATPLVYVCRKRRARVGRFEEQFPEALEFLSRAMRAGHAFSVSLEMIHSEFQEPVAAEFKRAFDEQNLGMPLEAALIRMGERIPLIDVQFFVSAVVLQKRTGGNLAEVLDKLAAIIRERFKLRGRIRAVSAHGRMTSMTLSSIPLAVGILMLWVNPTYASFFVEDDLGKVMIGAAVALQIGGYALMKKIVAIEV